MAQGNPNKVKKSPPMEGKTKRSPYKGKRRVAGAGTQGTPGRIASGHGKGYAK